LDPGSSAGPPHQLWEGELKFKIKNDLLQWHFFGFLTAIRKADRAVPEERRDRAGYRTLMPVLLGAVAHAAATFMQCNGTIPTGIQRGHSFRDYNYRATRCQRLLANCSHSLFGGLLWALEAALDGIGMGSA